MIKNTSDSYGWATRAFHWLISIMIICMLIVGFTAASMDPSEIKGQLIGAHKATGVIVLILVTLRLLWRLVNTEVLLPADIPAWQKAASRISHYILYIFMFIMPLSGIMMSCFAGKDINVFNMFTIPALEKDLMIATLLWKVHYYTAIAFVILIVFHIAAGLYHHFIRKDNVFMRMVK